MFLSGFLPLREQAGWCGGSAFCPGSCCVSQPLGERRKEWAAPRWVGVLHGARGSPPGCSLLLLWEPRSDTAARDGFPPQAWGCLKERGGKRGGVPYEVARTGSFLREGDRAITDPMGMGCSCTVSPWGWGARGHSQAMLGYMGQWDIGECVPTSTGIDPTWGAQLLSPIPTASLCCPGTKTCHKDASAHTGTVTNGVTTPIALLLPYSVIYGTFPHLARPADAGITQGVPPHLPAFVSRGRTTCQRVRVSTCVCILGACGGFPGLLKRDTENL